MGKDSISGEILRFSLDFDLRYGRCDQRTEQATATARSGRDIEHIQCAIMGSAPVERCRPGRTAGRHESRLCGRSRGPVSENGRRTTAPKQCLTGPQAVVASGGPLRDTVREGE